jgi:hypothetical protein
MVGKTRRLEPQLYNIPTCSPLPIFPYPFPNITHLNDEAQCVPLLQQERRAPPDSAETADIDVQMLF